MKIIIPTSRVVEKLKIRGDYLAARKQYNHWRSRTLESKMYIAVLFALCKGECPKCGVNMVLSYTDDGKPGGNRATLDHSVPLAKTMNHSKMGLEIMCSGCNSKKGDNLEIEPSNGFSFMDIARVK